MTPKAQGLDYLQVIIDKKNPENVIGEAQFNKDSPLFEGRWKALDDSVIYSSALPAKKAPVVPVKKSDEADDGAPTGLIVLIALLGGCFLAALVFVRCKQRRRAYQESQTTKDIAYAGGDNGESERILAGEEDSEELTHA